jgi:hypothetical protein
MSIDQNQAVAEVPAPQDKELAELSAKLNTTYIMFGDVQTREAAATNQSVQDLNAANLAGSVAATRALTKASNQYVCASDLCDAYRLKRVKLEDLTEEQLPEELRKLSLAERKAHIERKQQQRDELQAKIQTLGEAREKFLVQARREQAEAGANSLDDAVITSVRRQAERKEYTFGK